MTQLLSRNQELRGRVRSAKASETTRVDLEPEPLIEGRPLHPGQRKAWESECRIVAACAGWQSGKTTAAVWWLLREMQRRGPGDYVVLGPNYKLLDNAARPLMMQAIRKVFGHDGFRSSGDDVYILEPGKRRLWGTSVPGVLQNPKGSEKDVSTETRTPKPETHDPLGSETRILFRHAMQPEALEAFTAKAIWADEPGQMVRSIWEAIQARTLKELGRILLTSRPYTINWYITDVWQRRDGMAIEGVNYRTCDNPAMQTPEHEAFLAAKKVEMAPWRYAMLYEGVPGRAAGQVYDCVESATFVPRFPIPVEWPLWLGVDFGLINTAAVMIAEELGPRDWRGNWGKPTGRYFMFGSYHAKEQATAKEHLRSVRLRIDAAVEGGESQKPTAYGGSHQEWGERQAFALSGVGVNEPPISGSGAVNAQIACLYAGLKLGKLLIFDDLGSVRQELTDFAYELDEDGEPTPKFENEPQMHRLAAARYVASKLFKGAERNKVPKLVYGAGGD